MAYSNKISILHRFRDIIAYFPKFKAFTWPLDDPVILSFHLRTSQSTPAMSARAYIVLFSSDPTQASRLDHCCSLDTVVDRCSRRFSSTNRKRRNIVNRKKCRRSMRVGWRQGVSISWARAWGPAVFRWDRHKSQLPVVALQWKVARRPNGLPVIDWSPFSMNILCYGCFMCCGMGRCNRYVCKTMSRKRHFVLFTWLLKITNSCKVSDAIEPGIHTEYRPMQK